MRYRLWLSFAIVAAFAATPVWAATILKSAPLKGGAGGLICSCGNLTPEDILVTFVVNSDLVSAVCLSNVGVVGSCAAIGTTVRTCTVSRADGKSASTRQLACVLMSLDAAGNPIAVVPVDQRAK